MEVSSILTNNKDSIMSMKLSIIIPVYNVANTLEKCVESVISQGCIDSELILVDDGSPDICPTLCDELASKYDNVKVLHKTNGGLSSARNHGLNYAQGDYITFIDSDDELTDDTLAPLMQIMLEHPEYDIIEYPVSVHHGHESQYTLNLPDTIWHSAKQYWIDTKGWNHCYAWNKIYKRHLFDNVRFPDGKLFEDTWCYPELLKQEPKIVTTSKGLYKYVWNDNGITAGISRKKLIQLLKSEFHATCVMRTLPIGKGGNLYYAMMCRMIDIIKSLF